MRAARGFFRCGMSSSAGALGSRRRSSSRASRRIAPAPNEQGAFDGVRNVGDGWPLEAAVGQVDLRLDGLDEVVAGRLAFGNLVEGSRRQIASIRLAANGGKTDSAFGLIGLGGAWRF